MAITQDTTSDPPTERSRTIDLRDLGAIVPAGTTCAVTIVGELDDAFDMLLERPQNNWVLEGEHWQAELTAVYSEDGAEPMPSVVPDWVRAVCVEFGIGEVSR